MLTIEKIYGGFAETTDNSEWGFYEMGMEFSTSSVQTSQSTCMLCIASGICGDTESRSLSNVKCKIFLHFVSFTFCGP